MLKISDLNFRYATNRPLLWPNLNFALSTGKIYGLLGINGVGKTTLLKILGGLINPTQGQVLWQGQNIHQSKSFLRQYQSQVGFCFQDPEHLFFKSTVAAELDYHHIANPQTLISQFDLGKILDYSPFELSGGQQKILQLAIMLLKKPQLLLADEITANLDVQGQKLIQNKLKEYKKNHVVILVTHDQNQALQLCDELVFLAPQKVRKLTPAAILAKPEVFQEFKLLPPDSIAVSQELIAQGILSDYYLTNEEIAQALAMKIKQREEKR